MISNSSDINEETSVLNIRRHASLPRQPQNTPVDHSSMAHRSPPTLTPYLAIPPLCSPVQTSSTEYPYSDLPTPRIETEPKSAPPKSALLGLLRTRELESHILVPFTPTRAPTPSPPILTGTSRSVLSLISIQSKDVARRTEILLPAKYYRFYWTCCQAKQTGGFFTAASKTKCSNQNKVLDIHCKKCAHCQCRMCETFVRNSEGAEASSDSTINGHKNSVIHGQADVMKRLTGAYLMDWEDNGEVVGLGKV
ncbi:hypothetical protein BKA65DRAFT_576127 [Rhexocercosporidium sp. MPI-PUGE-AT-0058]|nr:hypothetical protein BKA65DRAFT_576127 [Rhexocercosporidium sp. MPI-PUGE-AT-0058]